MAALLTWVKDDKDKSAIYLNECRRMGIKVLPPDVNESESDFASRGGGHPLRPVCGAQRRRTTWSSRSLQTRRRVGRFADFIDFIDPWRWWSATSARSNR